MDVSITHIEMTEPQSENITVWLLRKPNSPLRMFFCMICRAGLLQYKGRIVQVVPGDPEAESTNEVLSFPFILECHGKSLKYGKCPARYIIQGYVEPV